jgi:hypothetical protein
MSYLFWAIIILFAATLIFYIVMFSLIYYWHLKKITLLVVPLLFTFEFFIVAFLAISIILLIFNYLPDISKLL